MSDELPNRMMHLPDGEYLLRSLTPQDWHRLQDFFYSHTEETIYQRYGHPLNVMSDQDAERMVSVDQTKDLALALLEVFGQNQTIHAVGRYCLDPDGTRAEVAFVVRESKRQLGCSACLMQEMIRIARHRELSALWASVLPRNLPMLKCLAKFGFCEISRDQDGIELELKLK
jgi:RimJ/RimL family protein N-acetyltransferase